MQLGLAFVVALLALSLIHIAWGRFASGRPAGLEHPAGYQIDLNLAGPGDFEQLPGIGPSLARRIVEDRQAIGPFRSVDELKRVPGIGPKIVDALRSRVYVRQTGPQPAIVQHTSSSETSRQRMEALLTPSSSKTPPGYLIDLNQATREQLLKLPGIGKTLADRILADREANGPYRKVSDITRVKFIKGKTFDKILPHIYVENDRPAVAELDRRDSNR